jgi:two-component system, OmpR family, phosphate regulon response regulator PhoB
MAKKVLIVEDQDDIRELISMSLEMEDYEIHEASNGERGLAAAQSVKPDLMLLDVMMPGLYDGIEVCKRVRADPALKRIKVVMLTARGQDKDREDAMRTGADEYLIKPFSPLELIKVVKKMLR